jgi:molecular chaperone GrpE
MSHDHHNHAPETVTHAQAPEAELPQAPPGAPEGHDASAPAPETAAESSSELDQLTAKAEKADEYLALAQRTKADFENYRKRASREAAAAQERGAAKLALALLPAIDNLDRALAHADDVVAGQAGNGAETLVAGLKHVHADLISALGNVGIERYSPEGEPFDPQFHEAVAQQPVEGAQPGVVVEVYQRGYRMGESVVRPARVVVAS